MIKKSAIALACVMLFGAFAGACNQGNSDSSQTEVGEYYVASKLNKTEDGRIYVEVDGEPMLYTGAQVRIDGYVHLDDWSFDELEDQFIKASSMNVNTVQLPLCWNDLEPQEGQYDFRSVRKLLDWALEYDLRIEFLWFTYQGGQFYCPQWIWEDEETYPQYQCNIKGQVWGKSGSVGYLVYTTPKLLEKERLVIGELTDFIYDWEKENDFHVIVTGYQIHNEPDNFPRWGISQREVKTPDGSRYLTDREAWNDVLTSLDNAGKAFKSSKWRALTRVNLTTLTGSGEQWKEFAPDVFELEGIDMVGDDTYTNVIASQKTSMANLMGEEFDYSNFAHVAENAANYTNTASLCLSAIAQGAGYLLYCLQLPYEYVRNETNWDKWEQGVYNVDGTEKAHTAEVRSILYGLKNAGTQMAIANTADIAAFNVDTDIPLDETTQEISTTAVSLKFHTDQKAIGFAVYYDGYVTVYCTQASTIELGNADFTAVEYGTFSGYDFQSAGEATLQNGNTLQAEAGKLYRIKVENIQGKLNSNTLDFIG